MHFHILLQVDNLGNMPAKITEADEALQEFSAFLTAYKVK